MTPKKLIETSIFSTRWLLIPFYIVLTFALAVYTYFDINEFVHYIMHINTITKEMAMVTFVELIDMTMIANLGKMIITGSYNSFVDKTHGYQNENVSSGMLKVKMATSLVGVTAIGILQKSVVIETVSWDMLYKLAFVHGIFLLSSLVLEVVDYLHEKAEYYHDTLHKNEKHEVQEAIHH